MFKLIEKLIKWLMIGFIVSMIFYSLFQLQDFVLNNTKRTIVATKRINSIAEEIIHLYENDLRLLDIIGDTIGALHNEISEVTNYTLDTNKLLKSSVFVRGLFGRGSGTVIKKTERNMYILTCYHVIDAIIELSKQEETFKVRVGYSRTNTLNRIAGRVTYTAKIVKYNEDDDLALLVVSYIDNELEEVSIADTLPKKGDTIYTVGNPLSVSRTISKGILSAKEKGYYYTDNTFTYGNSGGGLFNIKGELIVDIVKNLIKLANTNKKGYPFSAYIKYKAREYWAVNEVISKNDPTAHAEIQVIRMVCKKEKNL